MYRCEWDTCSSVFWSILDLERHVRKHVDNIFSTNSNGDSTRSASHSFGSSVPSCKPTIDLAITSKRDSSLTSTPQSTIVGPNFINQTTNSINFTPKPIGSRSAFTPRPTASSVFTHTPTNSWTDTPNAKAKSAASTSGPFNAASGRVSINRVSHTSPEAAVDVVENNAICTVCHSENQKPTNAIVYCHGCYLYYHQNCHRPSINSAIAFDDNVKWYCRKCAIRH